MAQNQTIKLISKSQSLLWVGSIDDWLSRSNARPASKRFSVTSTFWMLKSLSPLSGESSLNNTFLTPWLSAKQQDVSCLDTWPDKNDKLGSRIQTKSRRHFVVKWIFTDWPKDSPTKPSTIRRKVSAANRGWSGISTKRAFGWKFAPFSECLTRAAWCQNWSSCAFVSQKPSSAPHFRHSTAPASDPLAGWKWSDFLRSSKSRMPKFNDERQMANAEYKTSPHFRGSNLAPVSCLFELGAVASFSSPEDLPWPDLRRSSVTVWSEGSAAGDDERWRSSWPSQQPQNQSCEKSLQSDDGSGSKRRTLKFSSPGENVCSKSNFNAQAAFRFK